MRNERFTNCPKKETGSCGSCWILQHGNNLINIGLPSQEAMDYISEKFCPPNVKPELKVIVNKNGFVTERIIEGIRK